MFAENKFLTFNKTLILLFFLAVFIHGAPADTHHNQITIRNDRVFMLNGKPFFPIGVCFELGETVYNKELKKPGGGNFGFNFINLFAQNANLYHCFNSRNMISGDMHSAYQYNEYAGVYWDTNLTYQNNYYRIASYLDDGVYLLSDEIAFMPDDITHWEWNAIPPCDDNITLSQIFNQQVRDSAVTRINFLASLPNSKLIGFYSHDDANLFQAQGPNPPMYYYNNFIQSRFDNLRNTYNFAKTLYPNSMVLMSIPPVYFPRIFDNNNWLDFNIARDAWVADAKELTRGANVLFSPGYITMETWGNNILLYENGFPKWYQRHMKETIVNRVLGSFSEPKAVMGGVIFDVLTSSPVWDDPKLTDKVKWEIYSGLQSGATGLIFFGWHKLYENALDPSGGTQYFYRPIWNTIRSQIDTLVNVKHLDTVFTKTNYGQTGFNISASNTLSTPTYAIYDNSDSRWKDYYVLLTNNPGGSVTGPDEGTNNVTFVNNAHNFDGYRITEVFSNNRIFPLTSSTFSVSLAWFGSAMLHITNRNYPSTPDEFYLNQNYPNPFNPSTQIKYGVKIGTNIKIEVYDCLGRQVRSLVNSYQKAGDYTIEFNGSGLASGIYFLKYSTVDFEESRKMLLVK